MYVVPSARSFLPSLLDLQSVPNLASLLFGQTVQITPPLPHPHPVGNFVMVLGNLVATEWRKYNAYIAVMLAT